MNFTRTIQRNIARKKKINWAKYQAKLIGLKNYIIRHNKSKKKGKI